MTEALVLLAAAGVAAGIFLLIRRGQKRGDGISRRLAATSEPMRPGPVQRQAFDQFAACAGAVSVPYSKIAWRVVKASVPVDDIGRFEYRLASDPNGAPPRRLYGVAEGATIALARAAKDDPATNVHEIAHVEGYVHEDETFVRCVPRMGMLVADQG